MTIESTTGGVTSPLPAERIADWIAIHQLVSTFVHAMDNREEDLLMTLWAPDANWEFPGATHGTHRGTEQIRAFATNSEWPNRMATHHLATSIVIEFDSGDAAHGRSVAYAQAVDLDGKLHFPIVARYVDQYVKVDGRWVFKLRSITSDWSAVQQRKS